MITGIIYKYTSPSGRVYIGQTIDEYNRRSLFRSHTRFYTTVPTASGYITKIDKARRKYGPENFEYEVLLSLEFSDEKSSKDKLDQLEVMYIAYYDSYRNGYNSTPGGTVTDKNSIEQRNSRVIQNRDGLGLQEARFLEYDKNGINETISNMTYYRYRKSRGLIQKTDWSEMMIHYDESLSINKNLSNLKLLGYKVSYGKLYELVNSKKNSLTDKNSPTC